MTSGCNFRLVCIQKLLNFELTAAALRMTKTWMLSMPVSRTRLNAYLSTANDAIYLNSEAPVGTGIGLDYGYQGSQRYDECLKIKRLA